MTCQSVWPQAMGRHSVDRNQPRNVLLLRRTDCKQSRPPGLFLINPYVAGPGLRSLCLLRHNVAIEL